MWMIRNIIAKVSLLLFPSYCFICKKETHAASLCISCLSGLKRTSDTPFPFIISVYSFKDPHIKKLIHAIKYFHRKDLIPPLAKMVAKEVEKENDYRSYIVVPIPMPTVRKFIRGYNHTEELASQVGNELGLAHITDILLHNRMVKNQRQVLTHSRHERLKNKHNTFLVTRKAEGKNIILVDDVATTGATLREARKVLLQHGAVRVMACTIAH